MKVCLIQPDLVWEDPAANLNLMDRLIGRVEKGTRLVVLPEMFTTGFTMSPESHAEDAGGTGLRWMQSAATRLGASICGSIAVRDAGRHYNRMYLVYPDGTYLTYDKRHLFRMGDEQQHYTPGTRRVVAEIDGWKFCLMVCYDLRFPVWSRCRYSADAAGGLIYEYDALIYVANWPSVRSLAWKHLLPARAIENQCYVIGVNRCGTDGNGMQHAGDSMAIGPKGDLLALGGNQEDVIHVSLSRTGLEEFRARFPAGMDADAFEIQV